MNRSKNKDCQKHIRMSIEISVIICTHNRSDYLRKTINSLVDQSINNEFYEIIVIDNCSIDDTKQIVTNVYSKVDNIKYIYEPNIGLSNARNTGWKAAKGKYIAYIDDDAVADTLWLENILSTANKLDYSKLGAIGGQVIPIWETPRPEWLGKEHDIYFSIYNPSDIAIELTLECKHPPLGVNIIYSRLILKNYGGFEPYLGRKGNRLISGEETLLNLNILESGYILYYDPEIVVEHHIPSSRINKMWLLKRYFWGGYSNAYMSNIRNKISTYIFVKELFTYLARFIFNFILIPQSVFTKPRYYYFIYLTRAIRSLGFLYGLLTRK